jgi:hypothetical protein
VGLSFSRFRRANDRRAGHDEAWGTLRDGKAPIKNGNGDALAVQ